MGAEGSCQHVHAPPPPLHGLCLSADQDTSGALPGQVSGLGRCLVHGLSPARPSVLLTGSQRDTTTQDSNGQQQMDANEHANEQMNVNKHANEQIDANEHVSEQMNANDHANEQVDANERANE